MKSFAFKFPQVSHIGHTVSHAKNRKKRAFKYNLHTVTVMVEGKKQRMRVPTKILRMLKKSGVTTHYKPEEKSAKEVKAQPSPRLQIELKAKIADQPKEKPATKVEAKVKPKAKPKASVKTKANLKK